MRRTFKWIVWILDEQGGESYDVLRLKGVEDPEGAAAQAGFTQRAPFRSAQEVLLSKTRPLCLARLYSKRLAESGLTPSVETHQVFVRPS